MKYKWTYVIGAVILAIIIIRIFGGDESPNITHLEIDKSESADKLVVILHAFTNTRDEMHDIIRVTQQVYSDADIFAPNYNSSTFANTSLIRTAAQLDLDVQRIVEKKKQSGGKYKEIILIGHSIGALLARKSYLYSLGVGADHPLGVSRVKQTDWHEQVGRIILLAGMNRGWSTEYMTAYEKIRTWLGRTIVFITGKGKMVMSIERGAPFVTDLKLDWIRSANNKQIKAQVIQVLGKNDRVAPLDEHKELMATPNFVFIPLLEGATHANIIDLLKGENDADDANRERRKEAFEIALKTPLQRLTTTYGSNISYLDTLEFDRKSVKHVVFVMHGIRDHGNWLDKFRKQLENSGPGIKAITSEYGYFPMARFLLLGEREKNVRWFVDQYTEALALYPNATKFSFIGHSNGTYLLASALENYHALKFHRVYFAGSVVHSEFPWDAFVTRTQRVRAFRNDIAIDDWVVAWFPKLYQLINRKYTLQEDRFFNLGSGGFDGFTNAAGKENVKWVSGGHGGALQDEYIDSIVRFITQDTIPPISNESDIEAQLESVAASALGVTSNIAWLVWLFLLMILTISWYFFVRVSVIKNKLGTGFGSLVYVGIIIATLYSI